MNIFKAKLAVTCVAASLFAGPAMAHSVLESSTPADNATISSPETVEMTFSDSVNLRFSNVTLTGPDGARVETDKAKVSADGHTLVVPVSRPLTAGKYGVTWDALSQDGHKVNGEFSFTVE
jgi:copper resistance protein C